MFTLVGADVIHNAFILYISLDGVGAEEETCLSTAFISYLQKASRCVNR